MRISWIRFFLSGNNFFSFSFLPTIAEVVVDIASFPLLLMLMIYLRFIIFTRTQTDNKPPLPSTHPAPSVVLAWSPYHHYNKEFGNVHFHILSLLFVLLKARTHTWSEHKGCNDNEIPSNHHIRKVIK